MGQSPHLERAYELARRHNPHPNPRVGAVVVSSSGEVIGEGSHVAPGEPHAEVVALDAAGDARGATVYVSLEPCSHHGRTPPCADRLVADGVARVVVGAADPDPKVSGSGVAHLEEWGVEVEMVDDPAAYEVDPGYFHHRRTGLPLVTMKYAMTLDGSVAASDRSSQWITSEEARADAHALRSQSDAVVVGAGTLRDDDPLLEVRLVQTTRQPVPVVVAGAGELPESGRIWDREPLVVSTREMAIPAGRLLVVGGDGPLPDPVAVCQALAREGHLELLLEGGATLAGAWWRAGVVRRGVVYVGARVGGGGGIPPLGGTFSTITEATEVRLLSVARLGEDVRIDFEAGR